MSTGFNIPSDVLPYPDLGPFIRRTLAVGIGPWRKYVDDNVIRADYGSIPSDVEVLETLSGIAYRSSNVPDYISDSELKNMARESGLLDITRSKPELAQDGDMTFVIIDLGEDFHVDGDEYLKELEMLIKANVKALRDKYKEAGPAFSAKMYALSELAEKIGSGDYRQIRSEDFFDYYYRVSGFVSYIMEAGGERNVMAVSHLLGLDDPDLSDLDLVVRHRGHVEAR